MNNDRFIELTVQNHMIVHGFDEENKEIIEEVKVEKPVRKLISISRIQSVTEKYILTSYGFDRLIYWEYLESYEEVRHKLMI